MKKNKLVFFPNCFAVLGILLLGACDCSGGKGEGCGLFAAETAAAIAAPVAIVTAPVWVPAVWIASKGPEPEIGDGKDRITLENQFVPEESVSNLKASRNGFLLVYGALYENRSSAAYQTSFWTWDGQSSDFAGHHQSGRLIAESSQKLFFPDQKDPYALRAFDKETGTTETVSGPSCSQSSIDVLRALSDVENIAYCRSPGKIFGLDPENLQAVELYQYDTKFGFAISPIAVEKHAIGALGKSVVWNNYGPEKLSGSYDLSMDVWSMTSVPQSDLVAVSIGHFSGNVDNKGKIDIIDLKNKRLKFEIQMENNELQTIVSSDGHYLLVLPATLPHQIDVYDLVSLKQIGSISVGERYSFGMPVFEFNGSRFAVYVNYKGSKVYIFNIRA